MDESGDTSFSSLSVVFRRGTSRSDEKILFIDNLDGQTNEEFSEYLKDDCETKGWFGPAGCTDHGQPVRSHIGFMLKKLMWMSTRT